MRIFNRLGQRYLVRRATPLPQVGAPGPDLLDSADWVVRRAASGSAFHILPHTGSRRLLRAEGGSLILDEGGSSDAGQGKWRLEPVGSDPPYQRILDAADPARGLRVDDKAGSSMPDLDVVLGDVGRADPAAMWRIDEDCVPDARSIHLRYPSESAVSLFYNEVYPHHAPPGTYFCTSGFGTDSRSPGPSGYAGIQRRADNSQIAIFSVWHRMAGQETPVAGALATIVAMHPAAHGTAFSGEGSGSSIRLPLPWQVGSGEPVRFVITAETLGDDTVLSAYVARGNEPWISLGAILRAATGGRLMKGLYAFIEDFARTGNVAGVAAAERSPYRAHSCVFADPWVVASPPSAGLEPLREITVTAYSPHPLENLSAEPAAQKASFGVFLATGTSEMAQPSPVGLTLLDSMAGRRSPPDLAGVPYL